MDKRLAAALKAAAFKKNALRIRVRSKTETKPRYHATEHPKEKKFKQGWRTVGDQKAFFRSAWEANFGRYLQWQKERNLIKNWEHEPKTFWFEGIKRGVVSYLPDFKVTTLENDHYWVEVKGYMDSKSATKIKRFNKYFPEEKLRIVDAKWYKMNSKKLSNIIPDWEKETPCAT